ncbi:hypothetical protein K505DRAFT_220833, partial [Melanomma pulvis-pyrius CBS 109.77]
LEDASDHILKKLCEKLWDWGNCLHCGNDGNCQLDSCPWARLPTLDSFFQIYKTTSWSIPEDLFGTRHALRSHEDLFNTIKILKAKPDDPRSELIKEHFSAYVEEPYKQDQLRAFDLAMRAMTMVQCTLKHSSLVRWKPGFTPTVWHGDDSLRKFMASTFTMNDPV